MNKEIADKWADALPRFKQGKMRLRVRDEHCCLGVLCELAIEAGIVKREQHSAGYYEYGQSLRSNYLPDEVQAWAGLNTSDGSFSDDEDTSFCLANMNDEGSSFEDIGKVIREKWKFL